MSIHTCSYYCERPECVLAQRDELRQKLEQAEQTVPSDYSNSYQREWVNLTDEESEQILKDFGDDPRLMAVEIEVRLMEKNT